MNKKTQKKCVALLTLLAMVICTMFYTNTARAEENLPDCPIVKTYTCTVNGTVRTLTRYENSYIYMQIDDQKPEYLWHDTLDVGIDKLSTVWVISPIKSTILWWNYDLFGYEDKGFVNVYIWEYPKVCVNLQTGVRYNYSVWRFLLWQEEKVTHHRKQQCAK